VGDFAAFDRLLRAQVYARQRFEGLNCSFAQLCADLLSKSGHRRGFVGLMTARASLVSFPAPMRLKTDESENEYFAKRNETFRSGGRKSLKSL
jgi:hypothetical protein